MVRIAQGGEGRATDKSSVLDPDKPRALGLDPRYGARSKAKAEVDGGKGPPPHQRAAFKGRRKSVFTLCLVKDHFEHGGGSWKPRRNALPLT